MKLFKNLRFISATAITLISFIFLTLSRQNTEISNFIGSYFTSLLSSIGSRIWGIFPFSVGEIFIIITILITLTGAVFLIIHIKRNKNERASLFLNGLSWAVLFVSIMFFIVTFNCLINYNRTPFSFYSGLEVKGYTKDELRRLTLYLIDELNSAGEKAPLTADGRPIKPENFNDIAKNAMKALALDYPVLDIYYPSPKPVVFSYALSSANIAGIYFPITTEANYNNAMPVSSQGFTVCHELSHLSGFMREDEANFIAYLACRKSDSPYLRYSGYLEALAYALNAYYSVADKDEYNEVCSKLSKTALNEYAYRREYWAAFRKKPSFKVSTAVNDAYLKSNDQSDGVKSYGRVVDLMLSDFLKNVGNR